MKITFSFQLFLLFHNNMSFSPSTQEELILLWMLKIDEREPLMKNFFDDEIDFKSSLRLIKMMNELFLMIESIHIRNKNLIIK
jgi:hypothetical protein